MTHRLNKQKFQDAMNRRGWIMDTPTHSWIRPGNRTMAEAEQNWIDAILEAVECEPDQPVQSKFTLTTKRNSIESKYQESYDDQ